MVVFPAIVAEPVSKVSPAPNVTNVHYPSITATATRTVSILKAATFVHAMRATQETESHVSILMSAQKTQTTATPMPPASTTTGLFHVNAIRVSAVTAPIVPQLALATLVRMAPVPILALAKATPVVATLATKAFIAKPTLMNAV